MGHWLARVALFGLVGLVGIGCGGDDDGDSTAAAVTCEPMSITIESASDGSFVPPTIDAGDDVLVSAVAGTFCSPWDITFPGGAELTFEATTMTTAEGAECIARGLVDDLGASRVRQLSGLGTGPWSLLDFALGNNATETPIERSEAEQMVAVFEGCSETWKMLLIRSVTEGAESISDTSALCVSDRLADEDAREMLVGEIDRAYDDPAQQDAVPFPELIEPLLVTLDECLTSAELDRLDFS